MSEVLTPEDEADLTSAVMRSIDFVVDGRGDPGQHASALRRCVTSILDRHQSDRSRYVLILAAHVEDLESPGSCSCGWELWDGSVEECRAAYRDHVATTLAAPSDPGSPRPADDAGRAV